MLDTKSLLRTCVDYWGTLDLRSAGLFRITLSVGLIWQCTADWRLRESLESSITAQTLPAWTRLTWLDGRPWAALAVWLCSLLCFGMLLLGYRTRLATILSLAVFCFGSLGHAQAFEPGHVALLGFLSWALLTPCGGRLSLDALRRELGGHPPLRWDADDASPRGPAVAGPRRWGLSLAALGVPLQIGLIALYAAFHEVGAAPETAALSRPFSVIGFAALPLILCPWPQPWPRRLAMVSLGVVNLAMAFTYDAGALPWVILVGLPLLLSEADWRLLKRWLSRFSSPVTIYYDDNCGVCTKTCELLAVLDRFGRLRFIGGSDTAGRRHEIPAGLTENTLVAFDDATGAMKIKIRAVALVMRALPAPFHLFRLVALPGFAWFGDRCYEVFARNRQRVSVWLGLAACGIPQRPQTGEGDTSTASRVARLRGVWWVVARECAAALMLLASIGWTFAHCWE